MPRARGGGQKRGRQESSIKKRRAIQQRLRQFINRNFESRNDFAEHLGLIHTTVNGWFSNPPKVPAGRSIMLLCEKTGLSANWLLFGEGPEMRRTSAPIKDLASAFREHVLAAVQVGKTPKARLDVEQALSGPEDMLSETVDHYRDHVDHVLDKLWAIRQDGLEAFVRGQLASGTTEEEELFLLRLAAGIKERKEVLPPDILPPELPRKEHKGPVPSDALIIYEDGEGGVRYSFPTDKDHPGASDE